MPRYHDCLILTEMMPYKMTKAPRSKYSVLESAKREIEELTQCRKDNIELTNIESRHVDRETLGPETRILWI